MIVNIRLTHPKRLAGTYYILITPDVMRQDAPAIHEMVSASGGCCTPHVPV